MLPYYMKFRENISSATVLYGGIFTWEQFLVCFLCEFLYVAWSNMMKMQIFMLDYVGGLNKWLSKCRCLVYGLPERAEMFLLNTCA